MIILPLWGLWLGIGIAVMIFVIAWIYGSGAFRERPVYRLVGLPASAPHFAQTIASLSDSLLTTGNVCQFCSNVDEIQQARLELIAQATALIQFETFKMTPGSRADNLAQALCQRAAAGVRVQMLVDSDGTKKLPKQYWQNLRQAGVDVRFFKPFSWRSPFDYLRRNHRKLLIVDQQTVMIGGAGISDMWDGKDSSQHTSWYDLEAQWQGPVVGILTGLFWQHWLTVGGMVNLNEHVPPAVMPSADHAILVTPGEDPSLHDSPIRSLFQLCILAAEERLWIATPYLLPNAMTCRLLGKARQRGVDVRILTMGPKSDKDYVYHTSRERYAPLLNQDIRIHEYQPSMMHGKVLLIDDNWVSLGSANLDPRSFFHNDELNLCINSPALVTQVEEFFERGFAQSQLITLEQWRKRPLPERALGQFGNLFYWQM